MPWLIFDDFNWQANTIKLKSNPMLKLNTPMPLPQGEAQTKLTGHHVAGSKTEGETAANALIISIKQNLSGMARVRLFRGVGGRFTVGWVRGG